MGHQANLSLKGSEQDDLHALSAAKGWRIVPQNKPVDPDLQGAWIAYLITLLGTVTIAIKKMVEFDRAYDALYSLMDIRETLRGGNIDTAQLFEIELDVELHLKGLLTHNRNDGLAKFVEVVPSLEDLMESLVRAQSAFWLIESGLSADQSAAIIEACGFEHIGDALNYVDFAHFNECDGQTLLVALCGIEVLYADLAPTSFVRMAKQSLSKLKIFYPRDFDDEQSWSQGLEYNDIDFKGIMDTSKAILIARHAH